MSKRQDPFLGGMSVSRFLRDYWQKKPHLIRGAFPRFLDPMTIEDLTALSSRENVASRIIRESGGRRPWEVTKGPHDASLFRRLRSKRDWTLLVIEVNRWVPAVARLLDPFGFLPNVRVADVMVSFAAPGGNVGPHVDNYDVFLVQGQGERKWSFHTHPTKATRLRPGIELRLLSTFRPDVEEVLGPGDMLYLPPGFAHHGVAVTPCLTYSVGFRAPSAGEAWTSFADAAAMTSSAGTKLLADPTLAPADNPGAIPHAMLVRVRRMIRALDTSDAAIDRWFAAFSTELTKGHRIEPPRRALEPSSILARLSRGDRVLRSEEGRWAYLPRPNDALLLYVGGIEIEVSKGAAKLARLLCTARRHDGEHLRALATNGTSRTLLIRLFSMGALRFER